MQEPVRVGRIIADLHRTGVRLHLDDFGTGYSSLSALYQFPVDALKIDRSFIASMRGTDNDAIVRSIVALAHSLDLEVIAEGIEHPDQLERLLSLGCEYGQGFLFSKPLSFADLEDLLDGWASSAATQAAR
jgi:EAL domain-containing protein (putative c-di-GMP-specific phosphodiesterase class I)